MIDLGRAKAHEITSFGREFDAGCLRFELTALDQDEVMGWHLVVNADWLFEMIAASEFHDWGDLVEAEQGIVTVFGGLRHGFILAL
jgi:hypothetical protein